MHSLSIHIELLQLLVSSDAVLFPADSAEGSEQRWAGAPAVR